MSPVVTFIPIILISAGFNPTYAGETEDKLQSAHKRISEYRSLRITCTTAEGSERKSCFRQLNAKTVMYIEDKEFIAKQSGNTPSSTPLLTSQVK